MQRVIATVEQTDTKYAGKLMQQLEQLYKRYEQRGGGLPLEQ